MKLGNEFFITLRSEFYETENLNGMNEILTFATIDGFTQGKMGAFNGSYKRIAYIIQKSEPIAVKTVNSLLKKGLIKKIIGSPTSGEANWYVSVREKLIFKKETDVGSQETYEVGHKKLMTNNNINNINNIYDAPNGAIEEATGLAPARAVANKPICEDTAKTVRDKADKPSNIQTVAKEKTSEKKYTLAEYTQYVEKVYKNKTITEKRRLINKAVKEQWEIAETEPAKKKPTVKENLTVASVINAIQIIEEPETRTCPICSGKIDSKFGGCEKGCGAYHGEKFTTAEEERNIFIQQWLKKRVDESGKAI